MNLQAYLSEEDIRLFKDNIRQNEFFVNLIVKILTKRKGMVDQVNLDDVNWAIKRATKDGQLKELNLMCKLLEA